MKLDEMIKRMRNLHPVERCAGEACIVHNPSDHHMRKWDVTLRETALIERLCSHGVGHPDPDSWPAMNKISMEVYGGQSPCFEVHGCDGCCDPVRYANGHIASNGYWHPGRVDNCTTCPLIRLLQAMEAGDMDQDAFDNELEALLG